MTRDLHFETVPSWEAARARLVFQPLEPGYTAGKRLQSLSIHVRDHNQREFSVAERTLEAHYGAFVLSQSCKGAREARRWAREVAYGPAGREAQIVGRAARVYELGPEPPPDDIDGRSPAVVAWHDGAMFYLVASGEMSAAELMRIAVSLYPRTAAGA